MKIVNSLLALHGAYDDRKSVDSAAVKQGNLKEVSVEIKQENHCLEL